MNSKLIGNVRITPTNPRPAESFLVEVLDLNGTSYSSINGAKVYIDGLLGARRYLQAKNIGARPLLIQVKVGGQSELLTTQVNITGDPMTFRRNSRGVRELAILSVKQEMNHPYTVNFTLGLPLFDSSSQQTSEQASVSTGMKPIKSVREKIYRSREDIPRSLIKNIINNDGVRSIKVRNSKIRLRPRLFNEVEVTTSVFSIDSEQTSNPNQVTNANQTYFEWDFGDGTTTITRAPFVSHDYSEALTANDAILNFEVKCRVVFDNIEVKRSIALHSVYVLCKEQGTIVPLVKAGIYAHKQYLDSFYGEMEVTNLEEEVITLTKQAIVPLTDSPYTSETPNFRLLETPILMPANSKTVIGVYPSYRPPNQSKGDVPPDATGFTVYFSGKSATGKPVRFTHVFEIPLDEQKIKWVDPKLLFPNPKDDKIWIYEHWRDNLGDPIEKVLTNKGTPFLSLDIGIEKNLGVIAVSGDRQLLKGKNTQLLNTVRSIARTGLLPQFTAASTKNLAMKEKKRSLFKAKTGETAQITKWAGGLKIKWDTKIDKEQLDTARRNLANTNLNQPVVKSGLGPSIAPMMYTTMSSHLLEIDPVVEGGVCNPDNISDEDKALAKSGDLVCQLTEEKDTVTMPGRFMNAHRGDVVLSPGGSGLIGSLLRNLDPPQRYSHSGIMTRNYDELTHSTASESRINDYKVGLLAEGTDGIRANILQWMWPGVVTQRVEAAVNGEDWSDPESGKKYSVSSFSPHSIGATHNDRFEIVPPVIVKPDPALETTQIREKLHAVATSSRNDGAEINESGELIRPYKSHYRLFCYTDPTIETADIEPLTVPPSSLYPEGLMYRPTVEWAKNTYPSVCSSFIWRSMKKNGIRMEGSSDWVTPTDLEQVDIEKGAEVSPDTRDGLYRYSAKERLTAATWLFNEVHYQAYDEATVFGDLITDAADQVSNQIVNTFAIDNAWGKDNDDWKDVKDANAVSPDNILFWDSPLNGGIYGYAEPLIYREPRAEEYTKSRWKKVLTRGTISGVVRSDGRPISGANIALYDGMSDITDNNGNFTLDDVHFGSYYLDASKVIDGVYHSKKLNVSLHDESLNLIVDLDPPADIYRLAELNIDFYGSDHETFGSNDTTDPAPEYYEFELGPDRLTNHKSFTYKWGGEVRVKYDIHFALLQDFSILVNVKALLYEGTSESSDDLDGEASIKFTVPKGEAVGGQVALVKNTDEDEPETYGKLTISVKNVRNNN